MTSEHPENIAQHRNSSTFFYHFPHIVPLCCLFHWFYISVSVNPFLAFVVLVIILNELSHADLPFSSKQTHCSFQLSRSGSENCQRVLDAEHQHELLGSAGGADPKQGADPTIQTCLWAPWGPWWPSRWPTSSILK